MEQLNSKDPSVLATALREITSFIQQDPTDTDFFIMRATVSCEIAGSNKEGKYLETLTRPSNFGSQMKTARSTH
jgi:hypothetical protein